MISGKNFFNLENHTTSIKNIRKNKGNYSNVLYLLNSDAWHLYNDVITYLYNDVISCNNVLRLVTASLFTIFISTCTMINFKLIVSKKMK